MEYLRKAWLPWTAADKFPDRETFDQWLRRRLKVFSDLRMLFLAAATVLLLIGYVLDRRPVMLLCVLPLALVLVLSLAVIRTESALGQSNS